MNNNLKDTSKASRFTNAYHTVTISDIKKKNNKYYLEGPYATIFDISPPYNDEISFNNLDWTSYKRGNNKFNAIMSYYHIDLNQRYIQSLGFKNLLNFPINIDPNGADGADQSFFNYDTFHLEFGHGCVDDNEDATVIIHEYGHAILADILTDYIYFQYSDFGGASEGFSDYWAGSYKYTLPNGNIFRKNDLFLWDGVCWGGRSMNHTDISYNPDIGYIAHERYFKSDELFSTPLYQSFLILIEKHLYTREYIDHIILESFYHIIPDQHNYKYELLASTILHVIDDLYNISIDQKARLAYMIFYSKFLSLYILHEDYYSELLLHHIILLMMKKLLLKLMILKI